MPAVTVETVATEAAAHASRAMSSLLGQEVRVLLQAAGIKKPQDIRSIFRPDENVAAVLMRITGEAEGVGCLVFPQATADAISEFLTRGRTEGGQAAEMARSSLMEAGNVIVGAYLTVLCNMSGTKLIEHVPEVCCDMFGSILSQITGQCSALAALALFAEVQFSFLLKHWHGYLLVALDYAHSPGITRLLEGSQTPVALEKARAGRSD